MSYEGDIPVKRTIVFLILALLIILSITCTNTERNPVDNPPADHDSIPTLGLIAAYPFNRNEHDESGNGNHGRLVGNPLLTKDRFGRDSSAYFLSDSGDFIVLPRSIKIVSSLSISFWVQTSVADTHSWPLAQFIIDRDICNFDRDWSIGLGRGGKIQFNTGNSAGDNVVTTSVNINNNAWIHIVVVRDSGLSAKRIYINGLLNVTGNFDDQPFSNNATDIYVGNCACVPEGRRTFIGKIDDVRFYGRPLTYAEILQLYNSR
jgi:hypothetical protein